MFYLSNMKSPHLFTTQIPKANFESVLNYLDIDRKGWGVEPTEKFQAGTKAALENLEEFVKGGRLKVYDKSRNDPNVEALSQVSPWINHGQVY